MNSIDKRTSIRKFQDRPVEEEKLNRVLLPDTLTVKINRRTNMNRNVSIWEDINCHDD